eukprot:3003795-Pyramimonas_sp.AAC.1
MTRERASRFTSPDGVRLALSSSSALVYLFSLVASAVTVWDTLSTSKPVYDLVFVGRMRFLTDSSTPNSAK